MEKLSVTENLLLCLASCAAQLKKHDAFPVRLNLLSSFSEATF